MVSDDDLDERIFAHLQKRFLKVARIVAKVVTDFEREGLSEAEVVTLMQRCPDRIKSLADQGRIETVGNVSRIRYSEIRLKPE